jgi:Skp family chaperone for outer membrane proteins
MKKIIFTLLITLTSVTFAQKMATINMDRTFLNYYKTINAEKKLKKQVRIMEDRAVEMERRHKKTIAEYETLRNDSLSVLLSEDARKKKKNGAEQKQNDIRTMEGHMRSFNKDAREMLSKQHNSSRQDLIKEIQQVIEMISKNRGFEMVLDNSGKTSNLISSVVYSKKEMEITDSVLNILNKGHEKEVSDWKKEKEMKKMEAEKKSTEAGKK